MEIVSYILAFAVHCITSSHLQTFAFICQYNKDKPVFSKDPLPQPISKKPSFLAPKMPLHVDRG